MGSIIYCDKTFKGRNNDIASTEEALNPLSADPANRSNTLK